MNQDEPDKSNSEFTLTPLTGELPPSNLDCQDNRWRPGRWVRDWAILFVLIIIYLTWTGIIYTLEPGIR